MNVASVLDYPHISIQSDPLTQLWSAISFDYLAIPNKSARLKVEPIQNCHNNLASPPIAHPTKPFNVENTKSGSDNLHIL